MSLAALPLELLLLGVVLALSLLVGVPAIRSGVWLPRELEIERLPDEELSPPTGRPSTTTWSGSRNTGTARAC